MTNRFENTNIVDLTEAEIDDIVGGFWPAVAALAALGAAAIVAYQAGQKDRQCHA